MAPSRKKKTADLFAPARAANLRQAQPLAARMRPRDLDEFAGQEHFLGPGKLLRRLLLADRLGSLIFYGPPSSGKTTLASASPASYSPAATRRKDGSRTLTRTSGMVCPLHDG